MQKKCYKIGIVIPYITFLLLSDFLLFSEGCRNSILEITKKQANGNISQINTSETIPTYVKFRLFQNLDSTWGYTIFVNSRPYLHYTRIPFTKTGSGFSSKEDAEIVAGQIVKMIQNGNMAPKLDKRTIDSLEQKMKMNESDR
jgi:hypothetical protein